MSNSHLTSTKFQSCRILITGIILIFLITSTIFMNYGGDSVRTIVAVPRTLNRSDRPKFNIPSKPIILLWTPYFSVKDYLPPLKDTCQVDCFVTSNRDYLNLSSAVVFHLRDVSANDLPLGGPSDQTAWAIFNKESPVNTPKDTVKLLNGKINWTITYREDSSIQAPYGFVVARDKEKSKLNVSTKKPHLVCWIVSNCDTNSKRETYVKELQNYAPIEIYGNCGNKKCSSRKSYDCFQEITKSCKFYLAFENSICQDYTTEKFFYVLGTDMVPIVMGGSNYSNLAPKHSYINVFDFDSPKDLATYLLELDKNDEKYLEYHAWKSHKEWQDSSYKWSCKICRRLYNLTSYRSGAIANLSVWWYSTPCQAWTNLTTFKPKHKDST